MKTFFRCIRSDFYKFKHTSMPLIHIIIPLAAACVFLLYYSFANWSIDAKLRGFFNTIAIAFPIIIGLICSKAVEQEGQAGEFQSVLCTIKSRTAMFTSKLIVLLLMGICSVAIAVGLFALVFKTAPSVLYYKVMGILVLANIFIYILHLFVSFKFGNGASIGLGIAESLISSIALTGLGDGKWYYIPCTWGSRLCNYLVSVWNNPLSTEIINSEMNKGFTIAVSSTVVAYIICIIWFLKWEGRKCYD